MGSLSQSSSLNGAALEAWRSYLQSHASILRELDASLVAEHGMTARDYEVMLYLAQSPDRKLPMSALSERTMLTRSGITRLVDGLVGMGWIERISCPSDARVSYAGLTEVGFDKLARAGCTHVASIERLFLAHFDQSELELLAELLRRLPGAHGKGDCTVSAQESCTVSAQEGCAVELEQPDGARPDGVAAARRGRFAPCLSGRRSGRGPGRQPPLHMSSSRR